MIQTITVNRFPPTSNSVKYIWNRHITYTMSFVKYTLPWSIKDTYRHLQKIHLLHLINSVSSCGCTDLERKKLTFLTAFWPRLNGEKHKFWNLWFLLTSMQTLQNLWFLKCNTSRNTQKICNTIPELDEVNTIFDLQSALWNVTCYTQMKMIKKIRFPKLSCFGI